MNSESGFVVRYLMLTAYALLIVCVGIPVVALLAALGLPPVVAVAIVAVPVLALLFLAGLPVFLVLIVGGVLVGAISGLLTLVVGLGVLVLKLAIFFVLPLALLVWMARVLYRMTRMG